MLLQCRQNFAAQPTSAIKMTEFCEIAKKVAKRHPMARSLLSVINGQKLREYGFSFQPGTTSPDSWLV
jgi:hypothetical protein